MKNDVPTLLRISIDHCASMAKWCVEEAKRECSANDMSGFRAFLAKAGTWRLAAQYLEERLQEIN